jgi:tRNA (cytidine/uridine-2'-O-)-methyltransferase
MKQGHPQICLYQPEIPQNTGSIARLAAACCCRLHITTPTGFGLSDRNLRRPGLDYWPYLDLELWDNIEELIAQCDGKIALFSKFGKKPYFEVPPTTNLLIFGRETTGLPLELRQKYEEHLYTLPMFHPQVRSLNLANVVSIVVYDQLHRRGLLLKGEL